MNLVLLLPLPLSFHPFFLTPDLYTSLLLFCPRLSLTCSFFTLTHVPACSFFHTFHLLLAPFLSKSTPSLLLFLPDQCTSLLLFSIKSHHHAQKKRSKLLLFFSTSSLTCSFFSLIHVPACSFFSKKRTTMHKKRSKLIPQLLQFLVLSNEIIFLVFPTNPIHPQISGKLAPDY